LYKVLNFFGIKEHNKFVALSFTMLTILAFGYIGIQAASLIFGDGQVAFSPSPYLYAIMLTFPPLAYSYAVNSKLIVGRPARVRWFIITVAAFGMIGGSLVITIINNTLWYLIKLIPTYNLVRAEYPELFAPAFKTVTLVLPFIYLFSGIDFSIMILRDEDHVKGIGGFCRAFCRHSSKNESFISL